MFGLLLTLAVSAAPVHLRFGTDESWTDVHFSNESGQAMRACRDVEKQKSPVLVACTLEPLPPVRPISPGGRFFRSFDNTSHAAAVDVNGVVMVRSEWLVAQRFESAQACERFRERRADVTRRAAAEVAKQKQFLEELVQRQLADERMACDPRDAHQRQPRPKKALERQLYDLEAQRLERACTDAHAALEVTQKRLRETDALERREECVEAL